MPRGRPVDSRQQTLRKQSLIDSAAHLLRQKSYRSITIRDIADNAGTQSAMVSYYFGSKEGLFVSMFEQLAEAELADLKQVLAADNPLRHFIAKLLGTLNESPHITKLLVDEVLSREGELQRQFIRIFPARMARLLPTLLAAQQEKGLLRSDINPKWAGFTLMSMLITPFVARPVRLQAWEIEDHELASDAWAEHVYQLFMQGVAGAKP